MAKGKKRSRARRFGGRLKRHVKAAKPSLAIAAGLGIPAIQVVAGASGQVAPGWFWTRPSPAQELVNRFKIIYMGSGNPTIATALQGNAVKAGVVGFLLHYLANITGANRYLARMKAPVRI